MPRLLVLAPGELSRDPRARRAALAAVSRGLVVSGLCPHVDGAEPIALAGVSIARTGRVRSSGTLGGMRDGGRRELWPLRELRGLVRLARLARTTFQLSAAARRLGPFDIVHANDLDTLPAAWLTAKRERARLVYDAHELYTMQEPDPPRVQQLVAAAIEGALARRAAEVVTVSEPIGDELRRRLRLARPPLVVLNCPPRSGEAPNTRTAGQLRVVYQGAMGPGRPVADLLDAAAAAPGSTLTVRIANADLNHLREETERRGLNGRVDVMPPVAPDLLVESLHPYEVGVIINRGVTKNDELVFPNKLFEYMMAGLAVVAPALPGLAPFIEEHGIGVTFAPGQPLALAAALETLARERDRLRVMRERARRIALDQFNAETQADILATAWGL
jgi:glycosyltransferase involved in cell wall biosynthesis